MLVRHLPLKYMQIPWWTPVHVLICHEVAILTKLTELLGCCYWWKWFSAKGGVCISCSFIWDSSHCAQVPWHFKAKLWMMTLGGGHWSGLYASSCLSILGKGNSLLLVVGRLQPRSFQLQYWVVFAFGNTNKAVLQHTIPNISWCCCVNEHFVTAHPDTAKNTFLNMCTMILCKINHIFSIESHIGWDMRLCKLWYPYKCSSFSAVRC